MKHVIVALAAWAWLLAAPVQAAPTTYACTVQLALQVGDDGVPTQADRLAAPPGTRFIVDRTTGRFHNVQMFDNETGENTILDAGGPEMSFRLLSLVGLRTNVTVV